MPFIEVLGFQGTRGQREKATAAMTESLAEAWAISPDIISAYYVDLSEKGYFHAGILEEDIEKIRIFLKVHAFPRTRDQRRLAAAELTRSASSAFNIDPKLVAIYFFDREPSHVAHGGELGDG